MKNQPLSAAIKEIGSQTALAQALGVRQSHVWHWLNRSPLGAPAQYCEKIESVTGISKHDLRPDVFIKRDGVAA